MESKPIRISDHALVRYMERIKGENFDNIRDDILPEKVINAIQTLGGKGEYPVQDGENEYMVRIENYTVITIITK